MRIIDNIAVVVSRRNEFNYFLDSGNVIYPSDIILEYFTNMNEAYVYKKNQEKIIWLL